MSDLAPPWVLFVDKGKPKAILPAMRPGEVADVSHMTMEEAQDIVRLGNELYHALQKVKFRRLEERIRELTVLIRESGVTFDPELVAELKDEH